MNLTASTANSTCGSCNNGSASVVVSGGVAPYTYSWTNNITPGTTNIFPSKDNSIYEQTMTNSNGAGQYLLAGETNAGFKNRALMNFTVAGNIPAGASISNVSLQLTALNSSGASGPQNHSLYKILQDWGEGTSSNDSQPGQGAPATTNDATWLKNFYPNSDWTNQGGIFNASPTAATVVSTNVPAAFTWSSSQMVSDVQSWLDNPSLNYGWLLKSDETGHRQARRYGSKENVISSNKPVLTVNYGPKIFSTTSTVSNLAPGNYIVTVTDINGCTSSAAINIAITSEPPPVQLQDVTSYRGAFAPAPEPMWTEGWANWDPQNTLYPNPTAIITAVNNDTTWTTGTTIMLRGLVYVATTKTLTIQPGVVIRGDSTLANRNSSLIVTKGAKLNAIGTPCNPIVFTSLYPVGQRSVGNWGGIIILGQAKTNFAGGSQQIEGTAAGDGRNFHGGSNDADNSGTLKYVRIEYGGFIFAPNNEINGLTMGSVGSGTTIDYVQCSYINDDAFEWFGGTVSAKHLVAFGCLDDDFDTDNGFSGTVQYGLSVKDPSIADNPAVSTSEGFESDNDAGSSNNVPKTRAKFYNITHIGAMRCASNTLGSSSGLTPGAVGHRRSARIRRNSNLKIYNSIFMNDRIGLFLDGAQVLANVDNDSTVFRNNIMAGDFGPSFTYAGFTGTNIIAENAASRTRLLNSVYENDSVNTCSLLVNAWNLTSPDYRPNAIIATNILELNAGADLFPFIDISSALFIANEEKTFTLFILENGAGSTSGIYSVTIPALPGWDITEDATGTDNLKYVTTVDGSGNVTITSKAGTVLERSGAHLVGLKAKRKAGTAAGTNQNVSATVSGGGDVTPGNNLTVQIFSAN